MPATRTYPLELQPTLTQLALRDGLRDALSQVFGISPLKSYGAGTDLYSVWEVVFDSTKAFGKAFYRLKITSGLVATQAVGASFVDSTNALGNPSAEAHSVTYAANQPVSMLGFAGDGYKLLLNFQVSNQQLLGFFRPPFAPSFNEAAYPRIFVPQTVDMSTVYCTGLTPYSGTTSFSTIWGLANMGIADVGSQTRSLIPGGWLWVPSNGGILAQCSEDLAVGACAGMTRGDDLRDPNDASRLYYVTRGVAGALAIRI